ncbi:MAG: hypothetical protein NTX63_02690 [Candidatus Peregrinibacteria bacterium]|nr:hypothetical protein [Candidatus Peregrinibacteria bacterium]
MSGTPSNQPGETTKVPESGVEAKGAADVVRVQGGEVITNNTQAGKDRIAALLFDTVDIGTNGTSIG